jgi:xyloglucan-specific exo-beta-1,4-glucanase
VIFNPKEKDLIYGKTDMGGGYRWNPSDGTWIQLMNWVGPDQWGYTGAEAVATDPVETNRLYVAAGTYTNSWDPNNGAILRSKDKGETFEITPMPFKMGGNMPGRGMGEHLAVDPNKNSILYFGAREEKGLWKSTDYGVTWNKVDNFPDPGPYAQDPNDTPYDYLNHAIGIPWIIFDPSTGTAGSATKTLYVGGAQNAPDKPNLYRSTDAGATWEAIPGQPSCSVSGNIVTCTGGATWDMTKTGDDGTTQWNTTGYLPHQSKLDSAGTLYITLNDFAGPYNGNIGDVWKFEPGSSTWTIISPILGSKAPSDLRPGHHLRRHRQLAHKQLQRNRWRGHVKHREKSREFRVTDGEFATTATQKTLHEARR